MMMMWIVLVMMTMTGVGHHALAHGRHSLLSGDRQPALAHLAQVPFRLDARVGRPHPAGPSQRAAASSSHPAMHPVEACRPISQRL